MPFTPTPISEVVDYAAIELAVYNAEHANGTIAANVGDRIYSESGADAACPYVTNVLSILTERIYSGQLLTLLLDVTLTTEGRDIVQYGTTFKALQTALVDTAWPIPGYDSITVQMVGMRPVPSNAPGESDRFYRGRQLNLKVTARKV
jgi:hypothetical protein